MSDLNDYFGNNPKELQIINELKAQGTSLDNFSRQPEAFIPDIKDRLTQDRIELIRLRCYSTDVFHAYFDSEYIPYYDSEVSKKALKEALNSNPNRVWTMTLEGDSETIAQGYYFVNRMAYYIDTNTNATNTDIVFEAIW